MVCPGDPMERRQDLRAPSADKPASQGKGIGASPTRGGVARPKAKVAVVVLGRGSGGGGAILHGDHDGGGVGGNRMKQGKNHIGKPISRHLTRVLLIFFVTNLCSLLKRS
jgi:hypothetical protein